MEAEKLKKKYFLELQQQLARSERRHSDEIENLSSQLSQQISYNNTLLEQLEQLEQQQIQAHKVVQEASIFVQRTIAEKDQALTHCDALQKEITFLQKKLDLVGSDKSQIEGESRNLQDRVAYLQDELDKTHQQLAVHQGQLQEKALKVEQQENTIAKLKTLTEALPNEEAFQQLKQKLAALENNLRKKDDQYALLESELAAERERLRMTEEVLIQEKDDHTLLQDKHKNTVDDLKITRDGLERAVLNLNEKEIQVKSLTLDVEFLRGELKTAHKQASSYALERDERMTLCDALALEIQELRNHTENLESTIITLRKEKDSQQLMHEKNLQEMVEENQSLAERILLMDQSQHMELQLREEAMEEQRKSFEETLKTQYSSQQQQYLALQSTLQNELKDVIQDRTAQAQAHREERVGLEQQLRSIQSRLSTTESEAMERDLKARQEIERYQREYEMLRHTYNSFCEDSENVISNLKNIIQQSQQDVLSLSNQYNELSSAVSPLQGQLKSIYVDFTQQLDSHHSFAQQLQLHFSNMTSENNRIKNELGVLESVQEEHRNKVMTLEEANSKLKNALRETEGKNNSLVERVKSAEQKNAEIPPLRAQVSSLHDELNHHALLETSLQAKLDATLSQLSIIQEDHNKLSQQLFDNDTKARQQISDLSDHINSLTSQKRQLSEERDNLLKELEALRAETSTLKTHYNSQITKLNQDIHSLEEKVKLNQDKDKEAQIARSQHAMTKQTLNEVKLQLSQTQAVVLSLQEQRKQLQSENMDIREELERLYKHQQMVTSLQHQAQTSNPTQNLTQSQNNSINSSNIYSPVTKNDVSPPSSPSLSAPVDKRIADALKRQNKIIEEKCRQLQDNSMRNVKDFTGSIPLSTSPTLHTATAALAQTIGSAANIS
eukprot:TRINITY_DN2495_c0_g2_i1.p1 TRINITY_DN2495_c0_g2~~TRINITY_DN2495_c0_g2_i1.p1  ORF type:complete len:898 (+),score=257.46 TRINITY_DN2495_c0_g2_i1:209-2902(+)